MGLLHGDDAMSEGPFVGGAWPTPEQAAKNRAFVIEASSSCQNECKMLNSGMGQYVLIEKFCFPYHFDAGSYKILSVIRKKMGYEYFHFVGVGESFGDYCIAWREAISSGPWVGIREFSDLPFKK